MRPERWKKIKEILEQALELPVAERHAFLAKICDGDKALQTEVESLLEFDDAESDPLEKPAFAAVFDENADSIIGKQIDKYLVIEELGAGGMGAVYLATRADGAFEQTVALKLIKRGMDSKAVLRRFERERQILATLEHPNIARLIDGGTTDGAPFFVMEYVAGKTINDYAASENLDLEARLDLFREVCQAVAHAHRNLVIHRDLKPSNILVSDDGTPKLLDFGIAKLLKEDATGETATQNFVFTPEYASPEQVRGEKLTTATDVYSLGVILYELLTGNRPYKNDSRNIGDVVKAVCETEPTAPSRSISNFKSNISNSENGYKFQTKDSTSENQKPKTKNQNYQTNPKAKIRNPKALRGDLDNIILKSLRKEPTRRYSSVEQFSEDIRRHLAGLPVMASADTRRYRAAKFIQRNRWQAAAALLIFLTLLGGLGATLYQANVAKRERAKAEQRFNDVRKLANSFMFEINDEITKSPVKARELLVEKALEYLDQLAAESDGNTELKSELATAYEKIGEIQSEIFRPYMGKTSEALLSQQKSLKLREEVYAAEPSAVRGVDVAASRMNVGNVFMTSGKIVEARENYREAIRILEPQIDADPQNIEWRRKLAQSFALFGQTIVRSGSLSQALENYEKSLNIYRHLAAENPETVRFQRSVGIVLSYIGFVKMEMGRTEEAAEYYENWLEIQKKVIEKDANNIQFRHDLSSAHIWLGVILSEQHKTTQAQIHFNEGVKIQTEIFAADKENLGEEYSLADCHLEFGKAMIKNNLADESIENLEKAIEHYRRVWQTDTQNLMNRHRIANAQRFLADALLKKGNLPKALEHYEQSLAGFKELTAADPQNIDWQQDLAMNFMRLGEFALKKSDQPNALKNFETAQPIFERLAAQSPENVKRKRELEIIKAHLADVKN